MQEVVERVFRPNDTLLRTVLDTMKDKGHGPFERLVMSLRLRSLPKDQRQELEEQVTQLLVKDVEAGVVKLPVNSTVESGVLVGSWQDLFDWFIANWPKILEMILAIISLF
jgi:hypothetical protein